MIWKQIVLKGFKTLSARTSWLKWHWKDVYKTQDFMDSKGYQHVDTIEIDDIFLKKRLMKKWNMSKIPVKKVGSMSCSTHTITKIQFQIMY